MTANTVVNQKVFHSKKDMITEIMDMAETVNPTSDIVGGEAV